MVTQFGDEHDGGIQAAAHEAVLDGIPLEFMKSNGDAGADRRTDNIRLADQKITSDKTDQLIII